MRRLRSSVVLVLALAVACGEKAPSGAPATAERAPEDGAMCQEHGVLEAICTKHHPKLIPIFQAKGDWCEEHGFPESVCPICHPERGGKPAADVAKDDAPPDGTKVRFKSSDTARLAGLEVVKAVERPGGARLAAVASISYDATKRAEVNARSPGVVRALKADVGTKVRAGAPLAVVESAEVGADRSRLRAASSRVEIAEAHYRREQELSAKGISARKDVLAAQQEWEAAKAEAATASASLGVIGGGGAGTSNYVLVAPIAGTVTRRQATVGRMVDLEEVLFEIVDTSSMWAEIDIPETELARITVGQAVSLVVDGAGERAHPATIDYVAPEIDPRTRTAKARAALANPDGALRANMFGRAEIALGAARASVMVPRAAVQRVKDVALCFVRAGASEFEARRVQVGVTEGDHVEILKGLRAGEDVVAEGSFLLKTETLKGSIGAGCCE